MIEKFTRVYIRHYSDNGDTKCYLEWISKKGTSGRIEGEVKDNYPVSDHMRALVAAAARQGIMIEHETW